MGANRAMRRKQARDQIRDWQKKGELEQARILTQNGFTRKDIEKSYAEGHEDGYKAGTDRTLRTVYAGVVLQMLDEGNTKEEAITFLRDLDNRIITSISAGEDVQEVFEKTGVQLMLKEDFDRVKEFEEVAL